MTGSKARADAVRAAFAKHVQVGDGTLTDREACTISSRIRRSGMSFDDYVARLLGKGA